MDARRDTFVWWTPPCADSNTAGSERETSPASFGADARVLEARYREAVGFHLDGRFQEARRVFQTLLARAPGHPKLLHRMGVLARQEGDSARSVELVAEAIRVRPDEPAYHNNLGNALRDLGRDAEAERAYRHALALRPKYGSAAYNLGVLLFAQGRLEEATESLERAIAEGAHPLESQLALAGVRRQQSLLVEAEHCCQRALQLDPGSSAAQVEIAGILREQGRIDEAVETYRRLVRRDPRNSAAFNKLGVLLQGRAELTEARVCLDRALALAPNSPPVHCNRARLLEDLGEFDAARDAYERALALGTEVPVEVACHLAAVQRRLCDWRGEDEIRRDLVAKIEAFVREEPRHGLPPLSLNVLGLPAPLRLAAARQYAGGFERWTAEARARCAFTHANSVKQKLRVGYVSPDFRCHAVGTLVHGLFAAHDRDAVEVHAYSLVPHVDEFTRRVQSGCDAFTDVSRESPEQSARRIHADGIDVLVDLAGYTTFSRTAIFALRPAPVQLHWLGYLDTMGADFLPHLIADPQVVDPAVSEHLSEAVVYMPEGFAVVSPLPIAASPSRADVGLPENAFVYCCMNALHKIDAAVFDVWMRVLHRVPDAVLWLVDDTTASGHANLRREAERRGVDPERLRFAQRAPLPEYLARYALADLFLDTFTYNAGATAAGALYAGLPLLTRPGESFTSRMGASLAAAAGIPEAICASTEAYEDRAVALATHDRPQLDSLRRRLAVARSGASQVPLFDVPRFARHLEEAYRRLWHDHAAGAGPRPIRVPSLA